MLLAVEVRGGRGVVHLVIERLVSGVCPVWRRRKPLGWDLPLVVSSVVEGRGGVI